MRTYGRRNQRPPSLLMLNIAFRQSDFEDLDPAESETSRQGGPSILVLLPTIEL